MQTLMTLFMHGFVLCYVYWYTEIATCFAMFGKARAMYEAKKRGADNFKASDGWFSQWRWRHAVLKSTILHREVGGR